MLRAWRKINFLLFDNVAPTGGPEGLSCKSSGATSLRASWRPPDVETRGGIITHYTIQYTRFDADPLLPTQEAFLRVQVSTSNSGLQLIL